MDNKSLSTCNKREKARQCASDLLRKLPSEIYHGHIIVDIRGGKPIWVRTYAGSTRRAECTGIPTDYNLDNILELLAAWRSSGKVVFSVENGKITGFKECIELEKHRVG